jgi:hypothetical protein
MKKNNLLGRVNLGVCVTLLVGFMIGGAATVSSQLSGSLPNVGQIAGETSTGEVGIERTTAQIMADPAAIAPGDFFLKPEIELPGGQNLTQDPAALELSQWPPPSPVPPPQASEAITLGLQASTGQTLGTNFTAATLADTHSFPPDSMGAVGPRQFVVFVNGRIRTFDKTAGVADGVLDANPNGFFSSVLTPETAPASNRTGDPQIRYDRLSGRWILTITDIPVNSSGTRDPNRILIAVSDAASSGIISGSTVWTFYFVQQNTVGNSSTGQFLDYPSLGVDDNALYIGGNMFTPTAFVTSSGFVVRKSSILSGGPIVTTAFRNFVVTTNGGASGSGLFSPRGVDNPDLGTNEGYFIGVDYQALGTLLMRRVGDPGGTPSISASNISITVNTTSSPILVDHLGNTAGANGQLATIDSRLFTAQMRKGRLWTAHHIAVNASGVAATGAQRRNAARWYELNVPVGTGKPTVVQSGTVYDSTAGVANARQYFFPSVAVSGQGHASFGFSTAGTPFHIDCATAGRLSTDPLGTLSPPTLYTASTTAYNPTINGNPINRWGDYSFTSVDPNDDMTMWTIQEFCDANNSYGVRVAQLIAPPPATPSLATPNSVTAGHASVNVVITGNVVAGSGFFDPGAGFPNHIAADVTRSGGGGSVTVRSVSYVSPTSVTLDLNTIGAAPGNYDVTITNPDGQSRTGTGILTITANPLQLTGAVSRKVHVGVGTFDVDLPLSGTRGVECRSGGANGDYTMVFTFSNSLNSVDSAGVIPCGTVSSSGVGPNPNQYTVNLTGVCNAQYVMVTLANVHDNSGNTDATASATMGVLLADVDASGRVDSNDVFLVRQQTLQPIGLANFREDIDISGRIDSNDVFIARQQTLTGLPTPP